MNAASSTTSPRDIQLSIVVPTANGLAYWQRSKDHWESLRSQWPHFDLLVVSSLPRSTTPHPWLRFAFSGKTSPMARRFIGFSLAEGPSVLFLDDDCVVDVRVLIRLADKMKSVDDQTLLAGAYLSPESLGKAGRAFNDLCNEWLQSGPHFLSGAFCLPNSDFMHALSFGEEGEVGGEESRMSSELLARGGSIEFYGAFCVSHESEKSYLQFVERAFLQGRGWKPEPLGQALLRAANFMRKGSLPRQLVKAPLREWPWMISQTWGKAAGAAVGQFEKLVHREPGDEIKEP